MKRTYYPDRLTFDQQARTATVVPVHTEITADGLTPVSAFATVGQASGSYLLESVVGGERWSRYSFVGFDPQALVRGGRGECQVVRGEERVTQRVDDIWQFMRTQLAAWQPPPDLALPRFWGGAVGYVDYDAARTFEPSVGRRSLAAGEDDAWDYCFAVGGTVLVFDAWRQTLRIIVPAKIDDASHEAMYDQALMRIESVIASLQQPRPLRPLSPEGQVAQLPSSSFDEATFVAAVRVAQEAIHAGDIFQVVLSQRFERAAAGIDLFDAYRALRVVNPSPYMYFLRMPERTIAGASPETLVRLEHGVVELRPIAGTRRRGGDDAEDERIEAELLADPKERAEHVMLVDLGRNDIGRIAEPGSVRLTETMAIERYSHVMHIVSQVTGKLRRGCDALEVLRATFPAGTLSGAPKVRAMQIIDQLEPVGRGLYGGAVGYIGFDGNMDMAIAIRTLVQEGDRISLQAGAGIVEASDPAAEYQETLNKARAALLGLAIAERR